MALKQLHLIVAVVGIAAAGGAAWWYQQRPVAAPAAAGADGSPIASASAKPAPGGAASGAGAGPGGPGGAGPRGPVTVEAGRVQAMRIEDDAQAVGSLRARQSIVLRPEVSGRVSKLAFTDGQRVRQGQLLVQLDDTLQAAQLKQAEAQASIARTNLQRSRELAAQNFVSQSAVDQNAAALEVAQAQVALAQAQLSRMRMLAPFDAVTGIRTANVGDYLKDGADIVTLEDVSSMWVDFRLPERYSGRVKPGQGVELQFDSLPGRRFNAKVEALDSQLDANGRSLLVRARVAGGGADLRSGMFARTRIVFATREKALVVPEEALVPLGGKQFVMKLVDGPDGQKMAQRLEAKVGVRVPGKAEILEGLSEGDLVVTAGQARLTRPEPQAVRIVDLNRPAGGPPGAPAAGASRPVPAP